MRFISRLVAAAILLVSLTFAACSAELSKEQYESLSARILSFQAAMDAKSMQDIMGVVPPKVLDQIATNFGVTTADLVAATQQQFDEALKTVTFVSFGMDLENAEIIALADGTPYALIPTETVMDLGEAAGGKVRAKSSTLGLLDGETWYLVRVEDAQQVAILKQVYPAFADVVFPTGSMEPVTE